MKRTSQKSDAWLIGRIGEVFTCNANWTSSGLHQFQVGEIIPFFWVLQCFHWSNDFWCFESPHDSPNERDKKSTMLTSCFFALVMGIKLIQMYYICLLSQVTYFLALRKDSLLHQRPWESFLFYRTNFFEESFCFSFSSQIPYRAASEIIPNQRWSFFFLET